MFYFSEHRMIVGNNGVLGVIQFKTDEIISIKFDI